MLFRDPRSALLDPIDDEIRRARNGLHDLLSKRNSQVQIHSLPEETLAIIFHLSVPDGNACLLLRLLSVCRHWYTMIMGNPAFWTRINSEWWKATSTLLSRSKNVPLSVTWDDKTLRLHTRHNLLLPGQKPEHSLLDEALRHFPRIKWLKLSHVDPSSCPSIHKHIQESSTVIENVWISTTEDIMTDFPPSGTFTLTRASHLRSLHLTNIRPPNLAACHFPALEDFHLDISHCSPGSLDDILDFLVNTPLLTTLSLSVCKDPEAPYPTSNKDRVVPMKQLEYVRFDSMDVEFLSPVFFILSHLEVPQLEGVSYTVWGGGPLAEVASTLLHIPPQAPQPQELTLEDSADGALWTFSAESLSGDNKLRFFRITIHEEDESDRSENLVCLYNKTCTLSSLEMLKCDISVTPFAWIGIFLSSTKLTSVDLSLEAAQCFLTPFLELARGPALLPFLSFLKIDGVRCDGRVSDETTWEGTLFLLAEALGHRATAGRKLDRLLIRRHLNNSGWKDAVVYLPALCVVVGSVAVE